MPFFGTVAERAFRKKSKARKSIQIDAMLRPGFFSRKTLSVMVPSFGFFFSGFKDKGNGDDSNKVSKRLDMRFAERNLLQTFHFVFV